MIVDNIKHYELYESVHPLFKQAFEFLTSHNFESLEPGTTVLEKDCLLAHVQVYDSRDEADCLYEAHENFIDIQYVVSGTEQIGYAPLENTEIVQAYDAKNDILFGKAKGDFVKLNASDFMILFPQDAHMPGIKVDHSMPMKKVVVKIKVK